MPQLSIQDRTRRVGILCCHFLRNVAYYRTGHDRARTRGQFWVTMDGNFLDIAVLEWCKIFADERGKHHWEKIVDSANHAAFLTGLLSALGIDEVQFTQYQRHIRTYRDKFIAHLDEENTMNIPILDFADQSVRHLYQYLRRTHPTWLHDAPLSSSDYYDVCVRDAETAWQHQERGERAL